MSKWIADIEFEIPQRSGEVFCVPSAREFVATAGRNAELLAAATLTLDGMPLREVRRQSRRHAFDAASAYARQIGIDAPPPAADALLLATGHQPFFFHPGIWIKHLLVERLAGTEVAAISVPVDNDAAEEIGVDVPHLDGGPSASLGTGLRMVREIMVQVPSDVPYEAQSPPSPQAWQEFLRRVDAHLRTLPAADVRDAFDKFARRNAALGGASDIGTFMTMARRRYEGASRYLELPVSQLAQGPTFQRFVVHILRHAERFAQCYNRHLVAYRERYNVRTAAQPFPNLEIDGPRVELPFWILQEGRRQPLYAERIPHGWRLWASGTAVGTVRDDDAVDDVTALPIRPRALTLTAFTRLCLADLFVHGVGGGRYDRVTDAVIREFFGLEPPAYAVVTATLHLPLAEYDVVEERRRLQRQLLDLQHNPERALSSRQSSAQRVPAPLQALVDEKWRLIATLDGGVMTRRERRQVTQRIREINEVLARTLDEERRVLERRLAALERVGDVTAATHRGYPYCFFPPQAVDTLVERMLAGA